jgi:hypothetical protein
VIRLNGQEAVNQAYYVMKNQDIVGNFSTFYLEKPGRKIFLPPGQALSMLKNGKATLESLACEVQSVWDILLMAEKERSLFIHPCRNAVLVFNREYGPDLGPGIRAFAIDMSVFESAAGWAMHSPVINRDYDLDKFLIKLYPRMILKEGTWLQNIDLLRHSVEIARELIRIFRLDSVSLWEDLLSTRSSVSGDGEPLVHGGHFLDAVLENVREAIGRGFGMKELGCMRTAP